jgi:hypothetical protein
MIQQQVAIRQPSQLIVIREVLRFGRGFCQQQRFLPAQRVHTQDSFDLPQCCIELELGGRQSAAQLRGIGGAWVVNDIGNPGTLPRTDGGR